MSVVMETIGDTPLWIVLLGWGLTLAGAYWVFGRDDSNWKKEE